MNLTSFLSLLVSIVAFISSFVNTFRIELPDFPPDMSIIDPTVSSIELTVMTYNIAYNDGDSATRKTNIVRAIKAENADIFGLNEITDKWIDNKIADEFSEYSYRWGRPAGKEANSTWDAFFNTQGVGFYNAIFYKKDKFTCLKCGTKWLTDRPEILSKVEGSVQYRTLSYVILHDNLTGIRFMYVQTHLENNGNTNKTEIRKKQARCLIRIVDEILGEKYKGIPVIIGGDFNEYNESNILSVFEGYSHAYNAAEEKIGKATLLSDLSPDQKKTYVDGEFINAKLDNSVYDRFFVTDSIRVNLYKASNNKLRDGVYPSDHIPLVIEITIPYPSTPSSSL